MLIQISETRRKILRNVSLEPFHNFFPPPLLLSLSVFLLLQEVTFLMTFVIMK